MPEEPIVPVIRRSEQTRHPSEDELERERRIAREVREGRERFERKSEDRDGSAVAAVAAATASGNRQRSRSKPPSSELVVVSPSSRKTSVEQNKADENSRKAAVPGGEARRVSGGDSRKTSREELQERKGSRDERKSSRDERDNRKVSRERKITREEKPTAVPDILNNSAAAAGGKQKQTPAKLTPQVLLAYFLLDAKQPQ